jgi:hypothetical protein
VTLSNKPEALQDILPENKEPVETAAPQQF